MSSAWNGVLESFNVSSPSSTEISSPRSPFLETVLMSSSDHWKCMGSNIRVYGA